MSIYKLSISRRKVSNNTPDRIRNARQAAEYAMKYCYKSTQLWREQLYAVYLDRNNIPLCHLMVCNGVTSKCIMDNRLAIKSALACNADAIVLIHNHPSNNTTPSQSDIDMTDSLKKALSCFSIRLLDHVILGEDELFSFNEERKQKLTWHHSN